MGHLVPSAEGGALEMWLLSQTAKLVRICKAGRDLRGEPESPMAMEMETEQRVERP